MTIDPRAEYHLTEDQEYIIRTCAPWLLTDGCKSYNVRQLMERMGKSRKAIYNFLDNNQLDKMKAHGSLIIPKIEVIQYYLAQNQLPLYF